MDKFKVKTIAGGVTARNLTDQKFKTQRISMSIFLPLTAEAASANAVLPALVTRATRLYPSYTALSKHLAELYGATLGSSVSKIGDNQVLSIYASGIANRYALDGEDLAAELTELICSAVFTPLIGGEGLLGEDAFKQEKRQLLETIDADYNDKRIYANGRCSELLFADEPAGIKRYGSRETVLSLERAPLLQQWSDILRRGRVEIMVLGDCDFGKICTIFEKQFGVNRTPLKLENKVVLTAAAPKETIEELKIAQSKLAMGFRTGVEEFLPTRVMCVLLGGSASSKFFVNIREKMSLCYYCSARVNENKGVMFVESGVETINIERTKTAVLEQIQDICDGDFTDDELLYAKLAMVNSYTAVGDSLGATENWYLNQSFAKELLTPEETAQGISDVTRSQVIEAAKKLSLDTVFVLKGVSGNE